MDELLLEATDKKTEEQQPKEAGAAEQLARKLGEDATKIKARPDAAQILENLEDGVIIDISIRRPRFQAKLTARDLGLDDAIISEEARAVLQEYIYLGKLSVLPREFQAALNSVESAARQCLARFSIKSHWGAFVPITNYTQWKAENAEHENDFNTLRDKIISDYDELTEKGVEAYRPMALDIWERTHHKTGINQEIFIENYLDRIRAAIPPLSEVKEGFEYRADKSFVPLPTTLARDMEQAERIYKKRAAKDAEFRAEQERIEREKQAEADRIRAETQVAYSKSRAEQQIAEAQRRAELDRIERERRLANERLIAQHQAELDKIRRQEEAERDVIEAAKCNKQALVDQFFSDVVSQINQLVYQVATNAEESLERNNGKLSGAISAQLNNLISQLEGWNFMEDATITEQIERLKSVLPTNLEYEPLPGDSKAGKPKLDTKPLSRVLAQLGQEAEATLIELGHSPIKRITRQHQQQLDESDEPNFEETGDENEQAAQQPARKRRRYLSLFVPQTDDAEGPKRRPRSKKNKVQRNIA